MFGKKTKERNNTGLLELWSYWRHDHHQCSFGVHRCWKFWQFGFLYRGINWNQGHLLWVQALGISCSQNYSLWHGI